MDKIFDTNCSFHVKKSNTGKVEFLFFSNFLLVLTKCSFCERDWALGYNFMNVEIFFTFPNLIRPKSYVVRQLVKQLVYTIFITNNARFTCGERRIC